MSTTKIIQYTHRPNTTELGMGNTHETYLLIPSDVDLSCMFPHAVEVEVEDSSSKKCYSLKAANGREFRVNQMGELYRDYDMRPGDEVIFTKVEKDGASKLSAAVKTYNRVILSIGGNGAEVVNLNRLDQYLSNGSYMLQVYDRGNYIPLSIIFKEARKKRTDSPNTTDFYSVTLGGSNLPNGTYALTLGDKNVLSTFEKSSFNEIEFNDNLINVALEATHNGEINPTQQSLLTAIRTKPFILLAGISGTGKSRIVRKLAQATNDIDFEAEFNGAERWKQHGPSNFCLIQVKPNWHNSMDVVGFKSNIGKNGEHYEYTPFIEFIAKAWKRLETPHFLCLDEMNLAPVEEYFAEFLSAIESRSIGADGTYETDPIIKPFKDFGDKVAIEMINHLLGTGYVDTGDFSPLATRFYLKGMTLPKNLIVMGTVNMDETTFSFSRKVLDRAMSIEMNEVSYDDFIAGRTEDDIPLLTSCNAELVNRPISAQEVKAALADDATKVIDFLKAVNSLLEGTPFKLGYRAANEALLYAAAAKVFGAEDVTAALDDFTLMKILSRIEGDDTKLKTQSGEDLLEALMTLFAAQFGSEVTSKSQQKLQLMINTKIRDHFVSFWG